MSRTAIRSAVVTADRIVSALSATELNGYMECKQLPSFQSPANDLQVLYRQLEGMTSDFEKRYPGSRSQRQAEAAQELAAITQKSAIACLQGPAGCGKTKIALQYLSALQQHKRVFVFVPRTAIGETLFRELVDTYAITSNVEFISGAKKLFSRSTANGFETIETPEELQGTGNLVITTIDQLCKTMLSHQKIDLVTQLADSHVIFDEFHELIDLPGIVLLFLEIMRLRQYSNVGTLLVSATPNPRLLEILKVDTGRSVVKVESFNTKPLHIHLTQWNAAVYANGDKAQPHPFYSGEVKLENGAFMVCNTATVAQQASVAHRIAKRNVICFHSKFTPQDKSDLLSRILRVFGSQSTASEEVLVAGPIVQASLNITTRTMHTEMCHAENALQRIGRVNRFGNMDEAAIHFYFALGATKAGAANLSNGAALSSMHQRYRTEAFYRFLAGKHASEIQARQSCTVTLQQLYGWYQEFHDSPQATEAYKNDFQAVLTASVNIFKNNDFDPVQYPSFDKSKAGAIKLARNSLRGRSYYILPLRLQIKQPGSKGTLELLWNNHSDAKHLLTDELRASMFNDDICNKYRTWSKEACKPSILSKVTAGEHGVKFLESMAKTTKSFKNWNQVRGKAVTRETPILVCQEKYDDDNLYYFQYDTLKIGLIKAQNLAKLPTLQIKTAV